MSEQESRLPRRFAIGPVLLFPLLGPAAVALTMAVPLAVLGLFALGPGGVFYYFFLAAWWLPGLYKLLAPPFLLTGILVALAGFFISRSSVIVALIAAEFAFAAYFGLWLLIPGGVETIAPDYAKLWSGFSTTPSTVGLIFIATVGCWFIARKMHARPSHALPEPSSSEPLSTKTMVAGGLAMTAGAAALALVLYYSARMPATAWKDCVDGSYDDRIRGCSVIVEREAEESVERRATAYLRRGSAYDDLAQHAPRPPKDGFERAIADYSAAIRLAPELADAYARRGLIHAHRGDHDAAIADLDVALRLNPNILAPFYAYRVYRARGLAHFHKANYDRAVADHTEEIRVTPHYADGYLHRAAAYLAKGDSERAVADFSEAIRVEPFRPAGYVGRGSVFLSRGDSDAALKDFDEAIRRSPANRLTAAAYRKRGQVLESRGNLADARAAFEAALALDPSDAEARQGRERTRAAFSR